MVYKGKLYYLLFAVVPLLLLAGCGDLEPDMQDTRTVSLNMDFHGKSSSRGSSSVSTTELNQYNTHLVLALPSWEYLTSSYKNFYSSFAQELMNAENKKVSLEIPLNTQMKIFAFLFKENYSMSELFSGVREVGYYGKSESFSIDTQTNKLSLGITLESTTDTNTDGGSTDTTPPVIAEVTPITTPTSNSTPDYTFSSTEAGTITYGGSCSSGTTSAISGNNYITFNTLYSGIHSNCTIKVTDSAGNASNTIEITSFTVQTISNLPAPDNLSASGTSNSVTLTWNPVSGASSYTLYWDNVSGIDSSDNGITSIANSNYTHNNLDNGSTYYYKVAAVNALGTGTLSSVKIYITNLWDGLVAHYPFNGNAINVKGNFNGTVNGATLTKGRDNVSNTAYLFGGTLATGIQNVSDNHYINFGTGMLSGDGEFSIMMWINTTSSATSHILQKRDSSINGEYVVELKNNGKIRFWTYGGGYKWTVTSSSAVNDGNWHHLVLVQKNNGGQMYLDGSLEQTDNSSGKVNLGLTLKTYMGGDLRDYNRYYSGKVDDFRIYSRALSASEIQTLYSIID